MSSFLVVSNLLLWVTVALLGLGFGGIVAQIRDVREGQTSPQMRRHRSAPMLRTNGTEAVIAPPYIAVVSDRSCQACSWIVPSALDHICENLPEGMRLILLSQGEPVDGGEPSIKRGITSISGVDPKVLDDLGVRATPWIARVDRMNVLQESRPLGSPEDASSIMETHLEEEEIRR